MTPKQNPIHFCLAHAPAESWKLQATHADTKELIELQLEGVDESSLDSHVEDYCGVGSWDVQLVPTHANQSTRTRMARDMRRFGKLKQRFVVREPVAVEEGVPHTAPADPRFYPPPRARARGPASSSKVAEAQERIALIKLEQEEEKLLRGHEAPGSSDLSRRVDRLEEWRASVGGGRGDTAAIVEAFAPVLERIMADRAPAPAPAPQPSILEVAQIIQAAQPGGLGGPGLGGVAEALPVDPMAQLSGFMGLFKQVVDVYEGIRGAGGGADGADMSTPAGIAALVNSFKDASSPLPGPGNGPVAPVLPKQPAGPPRGLSPEAEMKRRVNSFVTDVAKEMIGTSDPETVGLQCQAPVGLLPKAAREAFLGQLSAVSVVQALHPWLSPKSMEQLTGLVAQQANQGWLNEFLDALRDRDEDEGQLDEDERALDRETDGTGDYYEIPGEERVPDAREDSPGVPGGLPENDEQATRGDPGVAPGQ